VDDGGEAVKWNVEGDASPFGTTSETSGKITFVVCCANAFAAYRGTATVRYT